MILKITHQAAQLLAIQDAKRAMKACDYDGVSFSCREAFADYRYEGLGDVLILNPGADARGRRRRDLRRGLPGRLASRLAPGSAGFGPRSIHVRFTLFGLGPQTFRVGRKVQEELGVDVLGGVCAALRFEP